jgi:hypothetical protein
LRAGAQMTRKNAGYARIQRPQVMLAFVLLNGVSESSGGETAAFKSREELARYPTVAPLRRAGGDPILGCRLEAGEIGVKVGNGFDSAKIIL